jgi:hypothetical protein
VNFQVTAFIIIPHHNNVNLASTMRATCTTHNNLFHYIKALLQSTILTLLYVISSLYEACGVQTFVLILSILLFTFAMDQALCIVPIPWMGDKAVARHLPTQHKELLIYSSIPTGIRTRDSSVRAVSLSVW